MMQNVWKAWGTTLAGFAMSAFSTAMATGLIDPSKFNVTVSAIVIGALGAFSKGWGPK